MKSVKFSLTNIFQRVGSHTASMLEAFSTGICSIAAFASIFLLDGWPMRLVGFVGFFVLACLIIWITDKLKQKAQS